MTVTKFGFAMTLTHGAGSHLPAGACYYVLPSVGRKASLSIEKEQIPTGNHHGLGSDLPWPARSQQGHGDLRDAPVAELIFERTQTVAEDYPRGRLDKDSILI